MIRATLLETATARAAIIGPAGLTSEDAGRRLAEVGPNAVSEAEPSRWRSYVAKFWSPIAWLLEIAMLVEIRLGKYVEGSVVVGLLLFNATLGFIQEGRVGSGFDIRGEFGLAYGGAAFVGVCCSLSHQE